MVGHPSPGVAGDPGVADAGVVAPGAIAEGIPVGADAGGSPGLAVSGNVVPVAVVVEVVPGGVVDVAGAGAGHGLIGFEGGESLVAVGIPLIPGVGGDVLGEGKFAGLLRVGLKGLIGADIDGEAAALIDVGGTMHDGELVGRGVKGNAEDGAVDGGGGIRSRSGRCTGRHGR